LEEVCPARSSGRSPFRMPAELAGYLLLGCGSRVFSSAGCYAVNTHPIVCVRCLLKASRSLQACQLLPGGVAMQLCEAVQAGQQCRPAQADTSIVSSVCTSAGWLCRLVCGFMHYGVVLLHGATQLMCVLHEVRTEQVTAHDHDPTVDMLYGQY